MVTKQQEKVNEVRHYMLDLFGESLTVEDGIYFIGTFIGGDIKNITDLQQRYNFIDRLVRINRSNHGFDEDALRRVLRNHVSVDLYNTIIGKYFSYGYTLRAYMNYLASGMAFRTLPRLETKMLLKSLLCRR